jgi:hypothetical protein
MSSGMCFLSDVYLTASQVLTLLVMILSAFASSVFGAGYVSLSPLGSGLEAKKLTSNSTVPWLW